MVHRLVCMILSLFFFVSGFEICLTLIGQFCDELVNLQRARDMLDSIYLSLLLFIIDLSNKSITLKKMVRYVVNQHICPSYIIKRCIINATSICISLMIG